MLKIDVSFDRSDVQSSQSEKNRVVRTGSYGLIRGGKLITTKPWSFDDTQKTRGSIKAVLSVSQQSSGSPSSDSPSDDSSGDSSADEKDCNGINAPANSDGESSFSEDTENTIVVRSTDKDSVLNETLSSTGDDCSLVAEQNIQGNPGSSLIDNCAKDELKKEDGTFRRLHQHYRDSDQYPYVMVKESEHISTLCTDKMDLNNGDLNVQSMRQPPTSAFSAYKRSTRKREQRSLSSERIAEHRGKLIPNQDVAQKCLYFEKVSNPHDDRNRVCRSMISRMNGYKESTPPIPPRKIFNGIQSKNRILSANQEHIRQDTNNRVTKSYKCYREEHNRHNPRHVLNGHTNGLRGDPYPPHSDIRMITGIIDGHVTRLATPPDPRHISSLQENQDESRYYVRHQYSRPPPVPRPRTMEGCELIPRSPRRGCSPSMDLPSDCMHRISCERVAPCDSHCCFEEDMECDSCDERHHHHRHSYHEGLHNAHEPCHHRQWPQREKRHLRRSASPCCWRQCHPPSSSTVALDSFSHNCGPTTEPSIEDKANSRRFAESDYIPLWRCHSPRAIEDRLARLEGDKETLSLQASILTDQIDAQNEKIRDLENALVEKKARLFNTEELLQKEIIAKSSLETQRLELLSEVSNLKLQQAAFERENMDLREKLRSLDDVCRSSNFSPMASSTPMQSFLSHERNNSYQTPPFHNRRTIDRLGTMPRPRDPRYNGYRSPESGTLGRPIKGVAFGKNILPIANSVGKRSTSAPNLAESEKGDNEERKLIRGKAMKGTALVAPADGSKPLVSHKHSGIRKIFTRLRRSSSGHLEHDAAEADFKRGGVRATASARLGWTAGSSLFKEPDIPFSAWSITHIDNWLNHLGLGQYCAATRCWMEGGKHISRASHNNLEKDLGVRHPLHRKKLQLLITHLTSSGTSNLPKGCDSLDTAWVLRWLDDLGLPQYKDSFNESRVDGFVLNYLTYDDLSFLRVSNLLHVTSLKRGIQVLREHNFDAFMLKRRSAPNEERCRDCPYEVSLWTNHRVMEWLKTVDLSEYAPNLRGSGVHGALLVFESKFTSDLLASLLSISSSKTLLRRHLSTHFKELVGRDVVQYKREAEISPGFVPISMSAKIKMPKKSQFSLKRRKTKLDFDSEDLVCLLDERTPKFKNLDANRERRQRISAPDTFHVIKSD